MEILMSIINLINLIKKLFKIPPRQHFVPQTMQQPQGILYYMDFHYLANQQLPEPEIPMVAKEIYDIKEKTSAPKYPTATSSLNQEEEYYQRWCGTTVNDLYNENVKKEDPLALNHQPLKRMLMKLFPWILDITEVRIKKSKVSFRDFTPYGPLEIHITVSPIHYSELMSPEIEKKVREKLFTEMLPLLTCMFENGGKEKPTIIFSPIPTKTILNYV